MAYESALRNEWSEPTQGNKTARRLVSFRMAEDQYATLRRICALNGARSVSDFVRCTVLSGMEAGCTTSGSLLCDLATLTVRLKEIDAQLRTTRALIARILGSEAGEGEEAPEMADLERQRGKER